MTTYRQFTKQRDEFLVKIQEAMSKQLSIISAKHFSDIILYSRNMFQEIPFFTAHGRAIIETLQTIVDHIFLQMAEDMATIIIKYAKQSYHVTGSSELEALSRLKGYNGKQFKPQFQMNKDELISKVNLSINQLRDKIKIEIERSYVNKDRDIKKRIVKLLPERRPFKKKLIRESEHYRPKEITPDASVDFMSENDWEDILSTYRDEFIPYYRDAFDPETGKLFRVEDGSYAWQAENEAVNEYLAEIKAGTNEAAKEAGVEDLLWISVLDSHTREEHERRDGLTSTEIEEKLKNEWLDDPYDSVAPSGFNCRCRSVPYIKELDDLTPQGSGDFDTWITSP